MHSVESSSASNDACRLCDEKKEKMPSIFSKNDEGKQILHLIKECLPVIIYRTDPLSKKICEECLNKLETFYQFKKTSLATATRHKEHLLNSETNNNKRVQLYLSCENTEMSDMIHSNNIPQLSSKATSTDDLTISCINCKSTCFDSTIINSEVELCAELHKAIADSLSNNKVMVQDPDKAGRSRRRRSQAFYHELDDSLCSSLTEFTNTESSQFYEEDHSEVESFASDSEDAHRVKRRKLSNSIILNDGEQIIIKGENVLQEVQSLKEMYKDEVEYRYFPLSLMNLALNVVNKKIVPGHEPDEFYEKIYEPQCTYCQSKFKNSKLLALHEMEHINIELGEKVDNSSLWHESRDDAHVRNRWLNSYDEFHEEDEEMIDVETVQVGESLLIPVGTEVPQEHKVAGEIILVMAKPTVNGVSLGEFSKEERKAFYKTMKLGGVNKKFCSLCRYSFKDNWAIESHYFSLACYYTCRYCGMRFNKQRHRFDEHVKEHEEREDPLSTRIYAASKLNNFVPRVIQPDKVKRIVVVQPEPEQKSPPLIRVKNFERRSLQPGIKIKEEKMDSDEEKSSPPFQKMSQTSGGKTTNQAYFCRKCYKVFFKLDEFNIHSKNCDYNQFPQNRNNANKLNKTNSNGEMVSPTGRPMRHCVKEAGPYRDEAFIPDSALKEASPSQQSFVCFICNTPFPTIYSRNSHMRIHKNETNNANRTPIVTRPRPNLNNSEKVQNNSEKVQSYPSFIKQEPLEPEIQIHESEQNYNSHNSIGTVSITPISKNPNQKATINPNIMKLVQNNPHLTIKANRSPDRQADRQPAASASNMQNNFTDPDKSYKCSSCWEAFSNKSHLYFHKKNQCEGSKYPCPFCKKRFGTEAAYSSHIFYSHPE